MRTVGFLISKKENENRRAILPKHIANIKNRDLLFVEEGYGNALGIDDCEYRDMGCHIAVRREILSKDIICDPKAGDGDYLNRLKPSQIVFGWIHATRNKPIADAIINARATAFAFENMFYSRRHSFWRNNELAGEAAIMHAFMCYGAMPYGYKVAVVGQGNTARGAIKILTMLGADVSCYNRKTERLFREEFTQYDVIVNAVLWDFGRKDHLVYRDELRKMKKNALIIDISCDRNGAIETSEPTTIESPTYVVDGVMHYVVDHTPALIYRNATDSISEEVSKYLDLLIEEREMEDDVLKNALIIKDGAVLDNSINIFQRRQV